MLTDNANARRDAGNSFEATEGSGLAKQNQVQTSPECMRVLMNSVVTTEVRFPAGTLLVRSTRGRLRQPWIPPFVTQPSPLYLGTVTRRSQNTPRWLGFSVYYGVLLRRVCVSAQTLLLLRVQSASVPSYVCLCV